MHTTKFATKTLFGQFAKVALPMTLGALLAQPVLAADEAEPDATEMVNALNRVFGAKPGVRASHAKGFCAKGEFTPDAQAGRFVKGPMFATNTPFPASIRFSIGGGNPGISDKSRSVRGLAVHLTHPKEAYDLVLLSEPVFFAATPKSFVSFLDARIADPVTRKPNPEKIAAHNSRYPEGKLQGSFLAAHAAPASYATTPYFSNHAFGFINREGAQQWARLVVEPNAGTQYLNDAEEKDQPDNFLEAELQQRLAKAPATFTIYAQLAGPNDSLTDPSQQWSGTSRVALGNLKVLEVAAKAECDGMTYVPTTLPEGIVPSADALLQIRAAAYAVSLSRRLK